ncbi:IS110 family transposase [Methylosinus sp. PW1]|uniref:IS110 family transposase n=1 Tax=Methylosinus sp. PW1 TaxID=107636 RepID=UPI000564195B|nr:IS110 family transposase [Methylosinus sp. PW1]
MAEVHVSAIDLAKRSFQVCGIARGGVVLFVRTVSRSKLEQLLPGQTPRIVAMEACDTSHYWGRVAQGLGHELRLIPPIYVKPFVKRQKNDAADAAAIAEAALRPNMHCVAVKSAEYQARAVALRTHQCFFRQRTQLINSLRGHLAEFGTVEMHRLCTVPGVGPITTGAVLAFALDLRAFFSGRNFAAWLGLVPRQHSAGGKTRLGSVSKMLQHNIRKLLIVGTMSRIRWIVRKGVLPDHWLGRILGREPRMVAVVALANKIL